MLYKIDLSNRTASVVWKFGGREYFSYALSSYTYSSDGHTLFNSGWHFPSEDVYNEPECTQFSNDSYDSFIVEFDENKKKIVEERREAVFGEEYENFVLSLTKNLNKELWETVAFIHDEEVVTSDFFEVYNSYFEDYQIP